MIDVYLIKIEQTLGLYIFEYFKSLMLLIDAYWHCYRVCISRIILSQGVYLNNFTLARMKCDSFLQASHVIAHKQIRDEENAITLLSLTASSLMTMTLS